MKNLLLLSAFLCVPFLIINLQAQSASDEQDMRTFARDFMAAYNRQDVAALKAMYSTDAIIIDEDGKTTEGAERIVELFSEQFIRKDITLLVRQVRLSWSDAQHALVTTGTYESFGVTYVYDIAFQTRSVYSNTMIKENGQWKIARSVVTSPVKTLIYQRSVDRAEWKSALMGALEGSRVLSIDIGAQQNNPTTMYGLLEWPSLESAQAFFKNPDWQKTLLQADTREKPVVVFLEGAF